MTDFDPEKFEDKYVHYFPELQRAYKDAFSTMNDEYDSTLVHAIDQRVLSESEPFYEEGDFRIELPEDPRGRIEGSGAIVDDETFEAVMDRYVEELESSLRRVFGVEPKA